MKKIIKSKVYDTDTAQLIYSGREELYRKKTGEYFIYDGQSIAPIEYDAARQWMKQSASDTDYIKEFGETESAGRVPITLYMEKALIDRARRVAAKSCIGLSAYIEDCIRGKAGN